MNPDREALMRMIEKGMLGQKITTLDDGECVLTLVNGEPYLEPVASYEARIAREASGQD